MKKSTKTMWAVKPILLVPLVYAACMLPIAIIESWRLLFVIKMMTWLTLTVCGVPFLIVVGFPAYLLISRRVVSKNLSSTLSGIVASVLAAWGIIWFFNLVSPDECQASSQEQKFIAGKLTPDEARTLKPVATEGHPRSACSRFFTYVKNGEEVEVSFLLDEIHGTRFYSSDDNETARNLKR